MDWALAEHQIPDSQIGFCPTRNTNHPLFILRDVLATAKKEKWRCSLLFWTSLLPTTVFQERNFGDTCKKLRLHNIWEILSKPCTQDASTFLLMATKLLRRLRPTKAWNRAALWVPFSPSVFPLYQWHWQILDRAERCCHCLGFSSGPSLWLCWWHCSHFKHSLGLRVSLQLQLNKFHNYTRFRGLKLNTDKTKIMVFFSNDTSAIPTFTYDGTPLELVNQFKYLGFTLTRDGSMHTAAEKMADNLRLAIARVYRSGSSQGITHRKHAMLWLFQVFALTAGLYGCQVWATFSLTSIPQ